MSTAWTIAGAEEQPIFGDAHVPAEGLPRGVIIIAHGFKGYKDYGMFPRIAEECAKAEFIAHRFNFSHSGMTNRIETFERPDLFERDTWNKQVLDLRQVIEHATAGSLHPGGAVSPGHTQLPYFIFGHSRGGVTAILTAGRYADDPTFPQPAGVINASAPSCCNSFSDEEAVRLLREGFVESPSSRTGQKLRVGKPFLEEQLNDPASHDVLAMVKRIRCPMLVIHGDADPTVDVAHARMIANAARQAELCTIRGADHVFNTPNPLPADAAGSPQLRALIEALREFCASLA